jgi:integrase
MARQVVDTRLSSRESRLKLKPRPKRYWRLLEEGVHLGYRRLANRAGSWAVRHYIGGQKYSVAGLGSADDYGDANGATVLSFSQAQARARGLADKRVQGASGRPLTVDDVMAEYLEWADAHGKSGNDSRTRYNAFIKDALGRIQVNALTTKVLRTWHVSLTKRPPRLRTRGGEAQKYRKEDDGDEATRRRRASANRTLTVLRAALNMAWREHRKSVPSADEWRAVRPFRKVDAARVRYLTTDEARRLLNASEGDFRDLVTAALQTGARYGELARLRVADFDPDAGTLAISVGKTNEGRHVVLTKEGQQFFSALCAGRAGSELLLRRQWRKSEQHRPMRAACKRARISPPVGFHVLRHCYASLSAMAGMPMTVIARQLGHSTTRQTEKNYAHLSRTFITDAVREAAPTFGLPKANVRTIR